jgi:ferredoxin-type protein NapF
MYFASYLANKCFEYLLNSDSEKDDKHHFISRQLASQSPSSEICFIPPPWAREIKLFKSICDGCGACSASCESKILLTDCDGYPHIDFTVGSCSFCGACAESCPKDALNYESSSPPWNLKAFITGACLADNNVLCRTCAEHCEEEAIIIPRTNGTISAPRILTDRCNGCGACYGPCPVKAIEIGESGSKRDFHTGGD